MGSNMNASEMKIASDQRGEDGSEEEERGDAVSEVVSVNEEVKIESLQQSSRLLTEPVSNHHLQGFMLLMKALCPKELTIYPGCGWDDRDESKIGSMAETSKRKSMDLDGFEEKEEEAKLELKGNKAGNAELDIIVLSDSDEEPTMDIPIEVLRRPPSEYRDKLIEELKRPFDEREYRELMSKSTFRTKKIVYKELRPMVNQVKTEATPRTRQRAINTNEDNKSYFDHYPGLEKKVNMATRGRRLSLLRGFFFWLQNNSQEQAFEPWHRGGMRKDSKRHRRNSSATPK